ncbi:MAG: RecX family transcriptional regulator [Prevotella sp.]|nr:RecX family transcriptional regulator [Prevotella sp.]
MKEMNDEQAFSRLASLCARSEHCEHDAQEKMRRWGISDSSQAAIMQRLVSERYVDNARYAAAFVGDKARYAKWGPRKIEQALWMKHVDQNLIREALDDFDRRVFVENLQKLLQQKRRQLRDIDGYEQKVRLIRFAMSRGFTMDIIRECMEDADEFATE